MNHPTIGRTHSLLTLALLCAATLPLGCTSDTTDPPVESCDAPYQPFDAANYQNQMLRIGAYDQIVTMRKADEFGATDFTMIQSLYEGTASLREKVSGRTDDHPYASVVDVGTVLDSTIMEAISAGSTGDQIAVQGQIVDKTLQRFFYLSVFHEMMKSQDATRDAADIQKGWDEAFGYFGLSNDGTTATGIAITMQKRDEEFGLNLTSEIYNGLVEGRCAVAEGDYTAASAILERVDLAMLRGFAASVIHEMDEYAENPLIKGWEGYLYWRIVAEHVRSVDAAAHTAVEAEFAAGVDAIDPGVVRDAVNGAFGLGL